MNVVLLVAVVADRLENHAIRIMAETEAGKAAVTNAYGLGFPEHMTFFGLTCRGLEKVLLALMPRERGEGTAARLDTELDRFALFQRLVFCLEVDAVAGHCPKSVLDGEEGAPR